MDSTRVMKGSQRPESEWVEDGMDCYPWNGRKLVKAERMDCLLSKLREKLQSFAGTV